MVQLVKSIMSAIQMLWKTRHVDSYWAITPVGSNVPMYMTKLDYAKYLIRNRYVNVFED